MRDGCEVMATMVGKEEGLQLVVTDGGFVSMLLQGGLVGMV